jgi:hypothetical protein
MYRHGVRIRVLWTLALLLGLCRAALADRVDPADYPYPYRDPYLATSTVTILKDRPPPAAAVRDLRLELLPDRNAVPGLEGQGRLQVRFLAQPGPAPLIFLVPGAGEPADGGTSRYLAQRLWDLGFHVAALPSPLNANFALAASRSGLPGLPSRDSADLYRALQATLEALRRMPDIALGRIGLLGVSHGALLSARLIALDAAAPDPIGFDTVVAVNPPVSWLDSARRIDRLADSGQFFSDPEKAQLAADASGAIGAALGRDFDDPAYFADWEQRAALDEPALKFLLGRGFSEPLSQTAAVVQTLAGLPIPPGPLGLADYLEQVLLPNLGDESDRAAARRELGRQSTLSAFRAALAIHPRFYLMHNADDFILAPGDLERLERLFGARATLYPYGGHTGNLWFPRNRQDLLARFEPLWDSRPEPAPVEPDDRFLPGFRLPAFVWRWLRP